MSDRTTEKLIRFGASGNIAEDFAASKNKKSAKLRALIQLCFFYHLIVGIVCAAVGFALSRGNFVSLAVCAAVGIIIAFFAAGGEMTTKASLVAIDVILAASGTIKAILSSQNERTLYFVYGGAALVGAVLAVGEMVAARLREELVEFPPETPKEPEPVPTEIEIKRKKSEMTEQIEAPSALVNETAETNADLPSYELRMSIISSIENKKTPPKVYPAVSEMRGLAIRLNNILNGTSKNGDYTTYMKAEINIDDSDDTDKQRL